MFNNDKTFVTLLLPTILLILYISNFYLEIWQDLLPFFKWLESSRLGLIGKTWGFIFAIVQAMHLLGLVVLGGCILLLSTRAMGLAFLEKDAGGLVKQSDSLFTFGLLLSIATGIFMSGAVALKIYYLSIFWYKMLALLVGILFHYGIMRPLLKNDSTPPLTLKCCGLASIMVWFTVAATGRWIGFSG